MIRSQWCSYVIALFLCKSMVRGCTVDGGEFIQIMQVEEEVPVGKS